MEEVAIGLGSNLGPSLDTLRAAVRALSREGIVQHTRVSAVYRTAPVGPQDQPPFLNAALVGTTALEPADLLAALKALEDRHGRQRLERWGPRTLDLDLLAFGSRVLRGAGLRVPHPELCGRGFVLVPLADVWPTWRHPELQRTVAELLAEWRAATPDAERAVTGLGPLLADAGDCA